MGIIDKDALIEAIKCHQRNQHGKVYNCKMEYCEYWREDKQTGLSICDTYKMQTDAITLLEEQKPIKPKMMEFVDEGVTWQNMNYQLVENAARCSVMRYFARNVEGR